MQKRSTVLRGKIISIPALSILSWCPQSSKALWDYSSTQAMTEAGQGQRGEETRCSAIPDLLQPWGKKRFCTEIREKPRDKAWGERGKHSDHQLLMASSPCQHCSACLHTFGDWSTRWSVDSFSFYFLLPQEQQHFFSPVYFQWGEKNCCCNFWPGLSFLESISPFTLQSKDERC